MGANRLAPAVSTSRRSYVVWELTLACNLACAHCGSRAGRARQDELSTSEALDVVRQLDDIGIDEVTLIGGEAFLRSDWLDIAAEITRRGMACTLTTGGYRLTARTAERMRAAGIAQASVSIDGMEPTHDELRGRSGSWRSCFRTVSHLGAAGIDVACNTQINRRTGPDLPELYEAIRQAGVVAWQLQMTVPMGNAADNTAMLLQPSELLVVFPMLARIAERAADDGVRMYAANNVGYFGPFEGLLRSPDGDQVWRGCGAGVSTLGLEADGTLKGCPSLPTAEYAGGNVRDRTVADIVAAAPELSFNRSAGTPEATEALWGFCRGCTYSDVCRAGCSWTAHTFLGRRGNNPYCHHRALVLDAQGRRERLIRVEAPPGVPFDHGRFALIEEPNDVAWPDHDICRLRADDIRWPEGWASASR